LQAVQALNVAAALVKLRHQQVQRALVLRGVHRQPGCAQCGPLGIGERQLTRQEELIAGHARRRLIKRGRHGLPVVSRPAQAMGQGRVKHQQIARHQAEPYTAGASAANSAQVVGA
jgi:hypothetical protein